MSTSPKMANPSEVDQESPVYLHLAVIEENLDVAEFLLKHGVCPNSRATSKQLSLEFPTDGEHRRHLLRRLGVGSEVAVAEALANKSCTALHLAVRYAETQMVELLLEHGAEVNAATEAGETPLLIAVLSGNLGQAELLLNRGADVNARTVWGKSIVHYAAWYSFLFALELLLRRGGHVNAGDANGLSALHMAADAGDKDIAETLLKHGADVNLMTKSGATALHYAAIRGNVEVVETLLKYGADIGTIVRDGSVDLSPFNRVTAAEERKAMEVVAKYSCSNTSMSSWYNSMLAKFKNGYKDKRRLFYKEV